MLSQLDHNLFDLGSIREQVSFLKPFSPTHFPTWLPMPSFVGGSLLNKRFLERYDNLIDPDSIVPLPTWKGIEWIPEDYKLFKHEEKS